jgi:NAD dependent epimerase/dehydratase family enzyme
MCQGASNTATNWGLLAMYPVQKQQLFQGARKPEDGFLVTVIRAWEALSATVKTKTVMRLIRTRIKAIGFNFQSSHVKSTS